jgi:hypothetical protein
VQYTIDAASRASTVNSLTLIPYNGNPYSTIWGVSADTTQGFDGDGETIRTTVAETTHDNEQGDETTTATTYLVRSSVLGGKVVTELSTETGQRGFVYLGNEVLAWQLKAGTTEFVKWEHRDAGNASFRMTRSTGSIDTVEKAELDALNTNAGTADPTTVPSLKKLSLYPGWGDAIMRGDSQCLWDGLELPCDMYADAINSKRVNDPLQQRGLNRGARTPDPFAKAAEYGDSLDAWSSPLWFGGGTVRDGARGQGQFVHAPQNPTLIPLGDLKGNLEALLKKGDCEKYTTKVLAEAAKLFAGSYPHVNTVMEGYGMISSQGGYVFKKEAYDTVGGDLFAHGASPGTVLLLQNGTNGAPTNKLVSFLQGMYTFKALHETMHLGMQGLYDDFQLAKAAYSYAGKTLAPAPEGLTGSALTFHYSRKFDEELKKHCPYPQQ